MSPRDVVAMFNSPLFIAHISDLDDDFSFGEDKPIAHFLSFNLFLSLSISFAPITPDSDFRKVNQGARVYPTGFRVATTTGAGANAPLFVLFLLLITADGWLRLLRLTEPITDSG